MFSSIPNNIAYHPHYPAMCTSGVEKIIKGTLQPTIGTTNKQANKNDDLFVGFSVESLSNDRRRQRTAEESSTKTVWAPRSS